MYDIRTLFPNVCEPKTTEKKKKKKNEYAIECEGKAEWAKKKFRFVTLYAIFVYRVLFAWTF